MRSFTVHGDDNPVVAGISAALEGEGIARRDGPGAGIVLLSYPLLLTDHAAAEVDLLATGRSAVETGGTRIVFLLPAVAGLPARRFPEQSVTGAAVLAGMRSLAMACGPEVLVNAVGVGTIVEDGEIVAGDPAFLRHASVPRAGTIAEVAATVLFFCDPLNSYTTGQFLAVDGGWMAGYGRNF